MQLDNMWPIMFSNLHELSHLNARNVQFDVLDPVNIVNFILSITNPIVYLHELDFLYRGFDSKYHKPHCIHVTNSIA